MPTASVRASIRPQHADVTGPGSALRGESAQDPAHRNSGTRLPSPGHALRRSHQHRFCRGLQLPARQQIVQNIHVVPEGPPRAKRHVGRPPGIGRKVAQARVRGPEKLERALGNREPIQVGQALITQRSLTRPEFQELMNQFQHWGKLTAVVLLVFMIYLAIHAGRRAIHGQVSDFRAYYTAAEEMKAGRDPYQPNERPYLYPPLLAAFY